MIIQDLTKTLILLDRRISLIDVLNKDPLYEKMPPVWKTAFIVMRGDSEIAAARIRVALHALSEASAHVKANTAALNDTAGLFVPELTISEASRYMGFVQHIFNV